MSNTQSVENLTDSQMFDDIPESQPMPGAFEEFEVDCECGDGENPPASSHFLPANFGIPAIEIKGSYRENIGHDGRNVLFEVSERLDYILITKESRYVTSQDDDAGLAAADVEEVVQKRWIKLHKEQCQEMVADMETLKLGVQMLRDGKGPEYRSMLGEMVQMAFSSESEQFCDIRKYYFREKEYKRTSMGVCLVAEEADRVLDLVWNIAPHMVKRIKNILVSRKRPTDAGHLTVHKKKN